MFRIATETDFLNAFRPRDRKHVEPPKGITFPMVSRDYVSWVDPTGVRAFLVFVPTGSKQPVGIAFRRDQSGANPASAMCDWCHGYGSADLIGLLTTDVSSKRRVGVNACLDLRCRQHIEDAANRGGKSLLTFDSLDAQLWAGALVEAHKEGRIGRLQLERVDDQTARTSPVAPALREAGFADGYKGLTLRT